MNMRINRFFTLILVLVSTLIVSCATVNPKEKLVVGNWIPRKAAPYEGNIKGALSIEGIKADDTTKATTSKQPDNAFASEKKNGELQRSINNLMNMTMKFNRDKTCVITVKGKTIDGKWKLKNKGKNLFVKDPKSGQKKTFEIIKLNDSVAVVIQRSHSGDIIAKYRKK
jgi:hypothetical protein